ncbi:MAG: ArsR/SmtB family transcription factor [Nocardioides sp.]
MEVIDRADAVRAALSPLRRDLLSRLREPASATGLAAALEMSRQRVNYHLRALAEAELIELVEERPRRGFVERIYRARPGGLVVDPAVIGGAWDRITDRYAVEHLVATAAGVVGDVGRMHAAATASGKRLMTVTIETEVRFASPQAVRAYTDELAGHLERLAAEYDTPRGRRHRLVAFAHPAAGSGERSNRGEGR